MQSQRRARYESRAPRHPGRWYLFTSLGLLLAGLVAAAPALAQEVYRWQDDEGKVHYTKGLPPDAASRPYDILKNGLLIRHVDPNAQPEPEEESTKEEKQGPVPLYTEEQKRQIGDRLLLLKYNSEAEIMEAMELEIDQLKYDIQILESSDKSVMQSLRGQIAAAANRQRAGMNVDEAHLNEILKLRRRLADNVVARNQLNLRETEIRNAFNADLERYRTLVAEPESSG